MSDSESPESSGSLPNTRTASLRLSCSPQGIAPPKVIPSEALFEGTKLVVIDHAGEPYRLMVTKNGKLILQK